MPRQTPCPGTSARLLPMSHRATCLRIAPVMAQTHPGQPPFWWGPLSHSHNFFLCLMRLHHSNNSVSSALSVNSALSLSGITLLCEFHFDHEKPAHSNAALSAWSVTPSMHCRRARSCRRYWKGMRPHRRATPQAPTRLCRRLAARSSPPWTLAVVSPWLPRL